MINMLNAFVCGNFHHEEEEDVAPCSSSSSPKKSKRSKDHHSSRDRDNNPYSQRGLDKFSELLADLDKRRQKVYSTMNPHDISFVRFTYSNTDDFVPIVIKNKDKKKHKSQEQLKVITKKPMNNHVDDNKCEANDDEERKQQAKLVELINTTKKKKKKNKSLSWINMLKYPSSYVPMVLVLILVMLTMFGRSFATLCTCVMWYIIPTLNDYISKQRKSEKEKKRTKKDYVRKVSEKNMDKVIEGLASPKTSSGKHSHQKSW